MPLEMTRLDPSEKSEGSMVPTDVVEKTEKDPMVVAGLIAYTDGSCKPSSSGFMGWGFHGYTYRHAQPDQKEMLRDQYITDAGYLQKHKLHWKFGNRNPLHVVPIDSFDFLGSNLNRGTNNQAEIEAITRALRYAISQKIPVLTIFTDSQYAKEGITKWCYGWERNNWITAAQEPVANRHNWEVAFALYKKYKEMGRIEVHWVKGHGDNLGNIQADILAGIASNYSLAQSYIETEEIRPFKQRWKADIDRHPFMPFKRVYFNTSRSYNTPGIYLHADPGAADNLIGKRIPEAGLAVIKLKEPIKMLEEVKERQYDIARDYNTIMMMKLDQVYDKDVYPHLSIHGRHALAQGKNNININWFDKKPICVEVGTTGLSMQAIQNFNHLEELLGKFEVAKEAGFPPPADQLTNSNPVNVHDVTDTFYTYAEVQVRKDKVMKASLKPEFEVGFKDMSVEVDELYEGSLKKVKIPLILGSDLLPRNNLNKLGPFNPRVYIMTWRESMKALRYGIVITTDEGLGIWTNYFSNQIFLK